MKNKRIEITADGFTIKFGKSTPLDARKGHKQHKSGSGIHGLRKKVRVRGVNAKRQWLESTTD